MVLRPAYLVLLLGATWAGDLQSAAGEGLPAAQIVSQRSGFTGAYPRSVLTDAEGRLWVATDLGGLFVGDGLRFLKVNLPEALQGGKGIADMSRDLQGRIWVLSMGGLGTWERGHWRVEEAIQARELTTGRRSEGIFDHPSGQLAVVASGRAYRMAEGSRPMPLPLPGAETDGDPSLAWQGDHLVANRGARFWREEAQGWTPLPTAPLLGPERPQGPVRCDAEGHLYLLTDKHLYHLAPNTKAWRPLSYTSSGDGDRMTRLRDGHIWILQNGRALRGLGGVLTPLAMPRDLSLYGAEARCLDAEGNLWITRTDLVRIPALGLVLSHTGLGYPPAREVWNIQRDATGALWVASEVGLFRRDANGWRAVKNVPAAHTVDPGPDGWLYTRSLRKLMRVEPRTLRAEVLSIPLLPGGLEIRRGPVIHDTRMWVMDTAGRLAIATWKAGSWTWDWDTLPAAVSRSAYLIRDEQGRPWLLDEHRVFCRSEERWEEVPFSIAHGLVDLTFPTLEEGLAAQFSPPTVYSIRRTAAGWTTRTVLGAEELRGIGTLYAVRRDPKGTIWLNTDRGVVRADREGSLRLQRFGSDVGLPADDTNQPALFIEGAERAWVGTALGLGEIRISEGFNLPPLAAPSLLEARCGAWVRQSAESTMTIRHGQGSVVWELGFPGPVRGEGAHFEFREASGHWAALAGTALQFPEISPGHHAYEVRVVPMLGPAGPIRRLEIHVLPPWYRHPAAYTLWVLTLVGTVYLGFRWRVRRLRHRNRELRLAVDLATEGLRARERDLELVNRRLYELNDAKNRVIGLAAHDLRNPINGILLHCELLQEDPLDPEPAKSIGVIRNLGTTMLDLIQRLLDVHAIEAGHAEVPSLESLNLESALTKTMERAFATSERKGIALAFPSSVPAQARADSSQVGQILDNLLGNAIKFSPPGTTITLGLEDAGGWWRAFVKDQGPGLTAEDLARVFGEYARLSARPTAGESSVGLGLSLVKRMAEAMGGRVGVDSVAGQGATFWLDLPKA